MVIWHPEIFLKRACNIFGNLALKNEIKGKKFSLIYYTDWRHLENYYSETSGF